LQIQAENVKFGLRDLDFVLTMVRSKLKESTIFNHGAGSAPKGQCFLFGWNYAKYDFNLYKGFFIGKITQICSIELKEENFKSSFFMVSSSR